MKIMSSLSHYYGKAKSGLMNINPHVAGQLAEDWMIAGGTGLLLGLMSAATGGMDKKIAGFDVPMDGVAAAGLAIMGLGLHVPELKVASIAAGGSASTRTFEKFFKKSLGAHGDFDSSDIPFGSDGDYPQLPAYAYGWGSDSQDRLVEAAKHL